MLDVAFGVGLTTLIGVFGWLIREILEIKTNSARVMAEHRNNGGSTTRDAIDRIERKLDQHIAWHMEGGDGPRRPPKQR